MAGGRFRCVSCFFACSSVLLLPVCLRGAEACTFQPVIHKQVGDDVHLSPCLSTGGITMATWKYGETLILEKDVRIHAKQFEGRLYLNPTDCTLTLRRLAVQDSGNFSFMSEVNKTQMPTKTIALWVHEPISKRPVVTSNSTWQTTSGSCTVYLDCRAAADSGVSYTWTVRNQSRGGSRLQDTLSPHDGATEFSCTVDNVISEMTASTIVTCSDVTLEASVQKSPVNVIFLSALGGVCLIVIAGIVTSVCRRKRTNRQPGSDPNDLCVYAVISEAAAQQETTTKTCTLYETIPNRADSNAPEVQTVYDKIQFSRMKEAYHDI